MFEFLFKYSPSVFAKGSFVLLGSWPVWLLLLFLLFGAAALAVNMRRQWARISPGMRNWRAGVVWLLQSAMLALVLLLLWQPAILISALKPQQNIIAVVVDDSRSMAIREDRSSSLEKVAAGFRGRVLDSLAGRFQLRLYAMSDGLRRVENLDELTAGGSATRVGDSLKQLVSESGALPLGAILVATDGADNTGGIDLETIAGLRSRRIPVHTIGYGRERPARDIELLDVQAPPRALADSRLGVEATLLQYGYAGRKARLTLRENGKVLAARDITLAADGLQQSESLVFNAGPAGAKSLVVSLDVQDGEENPRNNSLTRLLNVSAGRPRVLYLEGEPRWEFKFIRRALEEDRSVQLVTMLRTTQNKIYRQGISGSAELELGFPARVEELFGFDGLVIGNVEFSYFNSAQQELIRQFVDRRGGGLLFLGGRSTLSDGGYAQSSLADLLPVRLPARKGTFQRDPASVQLTAAGEQSLICRIEDDPGRNAERWKKLPPLADYQDIGVPKPGALVLAGLSTGARVRMPLLVTQNYGRGRTAVLATGGTWRWQMRQPIEDLSHEMFWTQLLRWLVSDSPGHVLGSTPRQMLADEGRVLLTTEVRDKTYLPALDARVEARILGPEGMAASVELAPDPRAPGAYQAFWHAGKPGSYVTEFVATRTDEEVGRDMLTFHRENGVAENFKTSLNRNLLERLAAQTGGRFWPSDSLGRLNEEISYSEAGLTVREAKELWNMPAVFLALLLLRAAEWILRRRWGVV